MPFLFLMFDFLLKTIIIYLYTINVKGEYLMKKNKFKKAFGFSLELIILTVVVIAIAVGILTTTKKSLKNNTDNVIAPKMQQDLWGM